MIPTVVKAAEPKTAVILAKGSFKSDRAKTAHGLIRHGRRFKILAVIDPSCAGEDASKLLGMEGGIPIVPSLDAAPRAEYLIIGVAVAGGKLPPDYRNDIKRAISFSMHIVNGLHDFLSDDKEIAELAARFRVTLWDVRKPPENLTCATGKFTPKCPIVLTAGTDAAQGKRTTGLYLARLAEKQGIDVGFLATGQTGIMIGCDEGVVCDRLPADFVSGEIEKRIMWLTGRGKKLIIVEGNGALGHHAYGPVALGILTGCYCTHIIMCHDPTMKFRGSFPDIPVPTIEQELAVISKFTKAPMIGIALRTRAEPDWQKCIQDYTTKYNLPVVDPVRMSSAPFLKALGMLKGPELGTVEGGFKDETTGKNIVK
jgi:uncharacterized NAD-dependent epimerase/dehydratase family protein